MSMLVVKLNGQFVLLFLLLVLLLRDSTFANNVMYLNWSINM